MKLFGFRIVRESEYMRVLSIAYKTTQLDKAWMEGIRRYQLLEGAIKKYDKLPRVMKESFWTFYKQYERNNSKPHEK